MNVIDYESFKIWLEVVNMTTLRKHRMSIYELEDDIPREILQEACQAGYTPERFVAVHVTPIFWPEKSAR